MVPLKRNIKKEDELADTAVAGCLEALKSMMIMNKGIAWCLVIVIFGDIKHLNNKHIFQTPKSKN